MGDQPIHILRSTGKYLAQWRGHGCRKWESAPCQRATRETAFADLCGRRKGKVRVIFIDDSGWYESHEVFSGVFK